MSLPTGVEELRIECGNMDVQLGILRKQYREAVTESIDHLKRHVKRYR